MMIKEEDLKTGMEIICTRPYGLKSCKVMTILQNWRGILRVEYTSTSGTLGSDVWSNPIIFEVTAKELAEDLNESIIDPYGDDVTIQKVWK